MTNDPCERCHERPHAWCIENGRYVCDPCQTEHVLLRFVLETIGLLPVRYQW